MDAGSVLGLQRLWPALLDDVSTAEGRRASRPYGRCTRSSARRSGACRRREACAPQARGTGILMLPLETPLHADDDPDDDVDEDEDDFDDETGEDDDEDDDEDEEEETWQVVLTSLHRTA